MAKYKLSAKIDDKTVEQCNSSNLKVVIIKESAGASSQVAWVTFSPFEINAVSWEETYGLYAPCTSIDGKAKIEKSSYTTASEKESYPFNNEIFGSPTTDTSLEDNTYEIVNNMATLTFGLAQNVEVNGVTYEGKPINAIEVLTGHKDCLISNNSIFSIIQLAPPARRGLGKHDCLLFVIYPVIPMQFLLLVKKSCVTYMYFYGRATSVI